MKAFWKEFCKRGLWAAGGGPVVLAIVYVILGATGAAKSLGIGEAALGILTVTVLAFIIGGISCIYQVEKLPLFSAVLIHGAVLYCAYILIYLINGWLQSQIVPILIFTGVFVVGYAMIWLCIYLSIRSKTHRLNQKLQGEKA